MLFERRKGPTTLYRQFDKEGNLLYVGISIKVGSRTRQHRGSAHWFTSVASITLEHFDTIGEAMAAEKVAINSENPQWNKMRNFAPPKKPKWVPLARAAFDEYPVTSNGVKMKLLPGGMVVYDVPDIL